MRRIVRSGASVDFRAVRVAVDYEAGDLKRLLALVEAVRGWYDYESPKKQWPVHDFHVFVHRGKVRYAEVGEGESKGLALQVAASHEDAVLWTRLIMDRELRPMRVGTAGAPSMDALLCAAKAAGCGCWMKMDSWKRRRLPNWKAFSLAEWR